MMSPLLVPPELNAATKLQNTWPMFRTSGFRSGFISYGSQRMGHKDEKMKVLRTVYRIVLSAHRPRYCIVDVDNCEREILKDPAGKCGVSQFAN